jgi:hypothetical protein
MIVRHGVAIEGHNCSPKIKRDKELVENGCD